MLLYMPVKVYSEIDCVMNHGKEMAQFGKKAMIVTGKNSSKINSSLQDVVSVLAKNNMQYVIYDGIEENPSIETVMNARDVGIKENIEFVIGIGGGSPLDAAKAIAMMVANPDESSDALYSSKSLNYLPIVCVPTTCGTGSEVTPYSILTIHKNRTKKSIPHKIYPTLALVDAKYIKYMSRENLINTCTDALAHLIESYLNTNSNDLNKIYAKEGLKIWSNFKTKLLEDTLTNENYVEMIHASMIAGISIAHTQTSIPHGLSYSITYELGVPHGKAVGIFLAGFVKMYKDKMKVDELLSILGFENVLDFGQYMKTLLGEVQVDEELMVRNVESLLENKAKLRNYPFDITKNEMLCLLL